jgi:hypothetical protein
MKEKKNAFGRKHGIQTYLHTCNLEKKIIVHKCMDEIKYIHYTSSQSLPFWLMNTKHLFF